MIYSKKKMEEIIGEITKLVAEYSEYPKVKKVLILKVLIKLFGLRAG